MIIDIHDHLGTEDVLNKYGKQWVQQIGYSIRTAEEGIRDMDTAYIDKMVLISQDMDLSARAIILWRMKRW